jgi:c-di-AMP phosphodiesterase-like protein
MKQFEKWRSLCVTGLVLGGILSLLLFLKKEYIFLVAALVIGIILMCAFFGFWKSLKKHGMKTEVDISRVLGKDAKDALNFGDVGIVTYNEEYIVTWASPFFKEKGINLTNNKLTSWISNIRTLFDDDVDMVIGKSEGRIYEITRKRDAQILYVKDITDYYNMRQQYLDNEIVIGLLQLDNYMEYQSYENEEIMAQINTHLRASLVTWAKENKMFVRRLRSDRFLVILNKEILAQVRKQNFTILQLIKDEANKLDVSITLSMAFAYGSNDFTVLDDMVNELIELAQSRGGDQAAIRASGGTVQFVGGNSETSSTRSKVRVRIMAQSIQEAIMESNRVYIAGHVMSDFDCMGACLALSSWVHALGKEVYIVLKDVPRDEQLQEVMNSFSSVVQERHNLVTPDEAMASMNFNSDLLIMADHGIPAISSVKEFVNQCNRILVIDHHRRSDAFVKNTLLTYVESSASSACELIVELLQNIPNHIPIYEMEATIMYLGILVDTNRFKMHTDARTFEAAAALQNWGANTKRAEKALCEDYLYFSMKNALIQQAKPYYNHFMIAAIEDETLEKTMMAQVSQALLLIKGCIASFTIAKVKNNSNAVAVSARSDGSYNVQKIMEKLNGGGHFSAAAVERADVSVQQMKDMILKCIEEEQNNESNIA